MIKQPKNMIVIFVGIYLIFKILSLVIHPVISLLKLAAKIFFFLALAAILYQSFKDIQKK